MELIYSLLANLLFTFMLTGYVVLTAGLMYWALLLGPKKKTRTYGFSRGGALNAI